MESNGKNFKCRSPIEQVSTCCGPQTMNILDSESDDAFVRFLFCLLFRRGENKMFFDDSMALTQVFGGPERDGKPSANCMLHRTG
jgi:hypothetical protein